MSGDILGESGNRLADSAGVPAGRARQGDLAEAATNTASQRAEEGAAAGTGALSRGAAGAKTETGQRIEAHGAFHFIVQLGDGEAFFTECTLPTLEVDVLEQKEGGHNTGVHLLPGPVKAGRITLKRGVTRSSELLKWYRDVASGKVKEAVRNISVVLCDSQAKEILRLDFTGAFPVKWSGPAFKAGDSTLAIETLELAFAEVATK